MKEGNDMEPAKPTAGSGKQKARLLECLTALMKEKDIKDISVKELSDLADINRGYLLPALQRCPRYAE